MMKKLISGLALLIFCLASAGFAQYSPSQETADFTRRFKGNIKSFSRDVLDVSVVNENPQDAPLSENIKHFTEFLIIVPDYKDFSLVSGSINVDLYVGNRKSDTPPDDSQIPPFTEWITYKDIGIFRSWKLAQLKVMVAKPVSSEDKTMLRLREIDFQVKFSESGAQDISVAFPPDPMAMDLFNALVLNPECESLYRLMVPPDLSEFDPYRTFVDRVNDSLSSGPVVKMIVYRGGLYCVSGLDLENAGVLPEQLSPSHMALYHANDQIPLFLQPVNNTIFGTRDKFYFYVPEFENKDYLSYWLLVEKNIEANPPKRFLMESFTRDPDSADAMNDIFSADNTARFYKKNHYHHKLPSPLINGNWFWDEVKRDEFRYYNVDINCVDAKGPEFKLTLYLTSVDAIKTNYCEIYWNKSKIGNCEWTGLKNYTFQVILPISLLKEGQNELVLYSPPRASKKQSSSIYFIGFEINYNLELTNDYGPLVFKTKATLDTQAANIWFSQPKNKPFFLLNVTDPSNPGIIDMMQIMNKDKPEYNYLARVNLQPENTFVLGSSEKALSVGRIMTVSNRDLMDMEKNHGDYVIVSHKRFLDALKPFVEFHEKKGNQPVVVDVDEIYDCFNFGDKDCEALKRFFKYRYYFIGDPPLRYGLLVGETSDFIGPPNEMPSEIQEDLIPLYQRGYPITERIHTDTPFTYICGDDLIPDFGIGRFPVDTNDDLQGLLRKIQNYDNAPPIGDWRNKHIFLTDDEPEFASIAETVIDKFPHHTRIFRIYQQDYPYSDLLMMWQRKTSIQARKFLMDHIDQGVLTLNYFGHGGPNLWSSERIFHLSDIPGFTNKDKMFFLTASTCDTCWLDYPEPPVKRSLGELMVLYPEGGAVGVYGPTSGATPSDHQLLMQSFYKGIFDKGIRNFSEAIIYSKISFLSNRANARLLDQYILLGDPAGVLNTLEPRSKIAADPAYIDTLMGGKVLIKGSTIIQPFWGLARVTIEPPDSKIPPVVLKTHVFNGDLQLEYELPPQSPTGTYYVNIYSDNPYVQIQELGKTSFEVLDPTLELTLQIDVPDTEQILENTKVNVKPRIANRSPIILENIQILLKQSTLAQPILERNISLQPNQEIGLELAWLAETGVHEMIWEARIPWDPEKRVFREQKFIPVVSTKEYSKVAVDPEEIQVKPDPLMNGVKPEFIIPVHNIGTHPFYELRLGVYVADKPIGKPKFIKFLKSGQRVEVAFSSEGDFPATVIPFKVKIDAMNQRTQQFDEIFSVNKIVHAKLPADLVILPNSVNFESEHFRTGETVFINARIKNQGDIPAENFIVQAFRDRPWDASKILKPFYPGDSQKFERLAPGEEQKVRLRWDFAQQAETLIVYVVANSNRTLREQDFTNNVAQASLKINSHTNLKIDPEKVNFSTNLVKKGDTMNVSFVVENDSDLAAGGFDVSLEQWGVNIEPKPCCEPIRVAGLDPGRTVLLSAQWPVEPPLNNFRININSTYLIEENLRHDNQVEFSFDNLEILRNFERIGDDDAYSFKEHFMVGSPNELEINPLREISPTDFQDAKGHRFNISSQYVALGAPVISNESDEDKDNQWVLKNLWLASSPFENAPPISLRFPLPPEIKTTMCDLYIYVHTNRDLNGYPASKIRIKVEHDTSFKTHDFSTDILPHTTVRYFLGRYDLSDRFLDITIDDVEEKYWCIVNHFEVVPLYSVYRSPVVEIPKNVAGSSFDLTFDAVIPQYTRIDYSYRQGLQGPTGMQWGEWKIIDLNNPGMVYSPKTPYLQWQAEFYSWNEQKPILKDARIRFK